MTASYEALNHHQNLIYSKPPNPPLFLSAMSGSASAAAGGAGQGETPIALINEKVKNDRSGKLFLLPR